jgi:hypothetical protein
MARALGVDTAAASPLQLVAKQGLPRTPCDSLSTARSLQTSCTACVLVHTLAALHRSRAAGSAEKRALPGVRAGTVHSLGDATQQRLSGVVREPLGFNRAAAELLAERLLRAGEDGVLVAPNVLLDAYSRAKVRRGPHTAWQPRTLVPAQHARLRTPR